MAATFLVVGGGGLNNKEKSFMVIAWLPKATAQVLQISTKKKNKQAEAELAQAQLNWDLGFVEAGA